MALPPQFTKKKRPGGDGDAEDLRDGGRDEAQEDAKGNIVRRGAPMDAEDRRDGGRDEASEDAKGRKRTSGGRNLPPWLQQGGKSSKKESPKVAALRKRLGK